MDTGPAHVSPSRPRVFNVTVYGDALHAPDYGAISDPVMIALIEDIFGPDLDMQINIFRPDSSRPRCLLAASSNYDDRPDVYIQIDAWGATICRHEQALQDRLTDAVSRRLQAWRGHHSYLVTAGSARVFFPRSPDRRRQRLESQPR